MSLPMKSVFENWDKRFETEELDEFRSLVTASLNRQQKSIQQDEASLVGVEPNDDFDLDGYRMHLEDRWVFSQEVQHLANELAIVALYKQVELHTKRVAKKNFPNLDAKKLSNIDDQRKLLPFDSSSLVGYAAFDELRLLNNSVKHEGKVSPSLARSFSLWVKGDPLQSLGVTYQRLHPLVVQYVQAFVTACYAHSQR